LKNITGDAGCRVTGEILLKFVFGLGAKAAGCWRSFASFDWIKGAVCYLRGVAQPLLVAISMAACFTPAVLGAQADLASPTTVDFENETWSELGTPLALPYANSGFVFTLPGALDAASLIGDSDAGESGSNGIRVNNGACAGCDSLIITYSGGSFDFDGFDYIRYFTDISLTVEGFEGGVSTGTQMFGPLTADTAISLNDAIFDTVDRVVISATSPPGGRFFSLSTLDNFAFAPPPAPEISVAETGLGQGAVVDGDSLLQGVREARTPVNLTFTITNSGTADLTLGTPTAQFPSNVAIDNIVIGPLSNAVVPGGGTASFTVQYAPSSAGRFGFDLSIPNNDADESPYDISVQGEATGEPDIYLVDLAAVETILDAGDTAEQGLWPIGETVDLTLIVRNPGSDDLTISTASASNASNVRVDAIGAPSGTVLAPSSGEESFIVQYTPTAAGPFSFDLAIPTDVAGKNPFNLTVSGTGFGDPEISISSSESGDVAAGGVDAHGEEPEAVEKTVTYTITNSGTDTLTLAGTATVSDLLNITGAVTVGNYSASSLDPAGGEASFDITYTPTSAGAYGFTLSVESNDADEGNYSIFVNGEATDITPPNVTISSQAVEPVTGAFSVTITFSEEVAGFTLADLAVSNGAASDFAGSGAVYTALITPAADGEVTIDIAAAAAQDAAGNDNLAASQFSIGSDISAPVLTITLPGDEAEGPFTATFDFNEAVTGFELSDITVGNGAASDFTITNASSYTAVITPGTFGEVSVSAGENAAQDGAGNGSVAASASLDAVTPELEVDIRINDTVADVTDISGQARIRNPGSLAIPYRTEIDVDWLSVDPASGTIPSLGDLDLTISVLEAAEDLDPGVYTGTVTLFNETTAQAAVKGPNASARAAGDNVIVEIPLSITIEERYGTIQLVSTTPGGLQRDASFGFASSTVAEFDGLSLSTQQGQAASEAVELLFGSYDVTQSVPAGWRIGAITCVGDNDGGSVIDLANGRVDIDLDPSEAIVCTFENTRDEEAVRLATMRAINNFMVRRADRILTSAPDLSSRLRDREATSPGRFSADITMGRGTMSLGTSLAGLRHHAKANQPQMPSLSDGDERGENASNLDIWFAAERSYVSDERDGAETSSDFTIAQMGMDWLFGDTLVGVMVQGDWSDEVTDDIAEDAGAVRGARVAGQGWMAGPYIVREVGDGVLLDVMALWGQSTNQVNPLGLYEDEFETSRYMLRANLSGEWQLDSWQIRPEASLAHFSETQDAYADSLGIVIPEQTVSIGRFQAGPTIAYRWNGQDGVWVEPSLRLRAVWDYDAADLMNESGILVSTGDLRADADLGLSARLPNGAYLDVETGLAGLGDSDFSANSFRVDVRLPF